MLMTPVKALRISAQKPLHPIDQIGLSGFHHEMKMIAHQTVSVHLPAGLGAGLSKGKEKLLPILLIQENKLAPITAAHQVIAGTRILNAQRSSH